MQRVPRRTRVPDGVPAPRARRPGGRAVRSVRAVHRRASRRRRDRSRARDATRSRSCAGRASTFEPRKQWPDGSRRSRPSSAPKPAGCCAHYGNGGWGTVVKEQKVDGAYSDELVGAGRPGRDSGRSIRPRRGSRACRRCVIPNSFRRSQRGRGPVGPAVRAAGRQGARDAAAEGAEQQRPAVRQRRGAFGADGARAAGPVLLIDDIVDSGWTLTVIAALLRQNGSGPVLPDAPRASEERLRVAMSRRSDSALASLLLVSRSCHPTNGRSSAKEYWALDRAGRGPGALLGLCRRTRALSAASSHRGSRACSIVRPRWPSSSKRWSTAGIVTLSPFDDAYPEAMARAPGRVGTARSCTRSARELLELGGVAIVGSRDVGPEAADVAKAAAARAARAGRVVMSGGARGTDRLAMNAAIEATATSSACSPTRS